MTMVLCEDLNAGRQRVILENMSCNAAYRVLKLSLLPGVKVSRVRELLREVSRRNHLAIHCEIVGDHLRVLAPMEGALDPCWLPEAGPDGRIPIGLGSDGPVLSEGSLLVTGAPGTGRTTLLRAMSMAAEGAGMDFSFLDRNASGDEISAVLSTLRSCASDEGPVHWLLVDDLDLCHLPAGALQDLVVLARGRASVRVAVSVSGSDLALERILAYNFREMLSFHPGILRTYQHRPFDELAPDEAMFCSGEDLPKYIRIPKYPKNAFTTTES